MIVPPWEDPRVIAGLTRQLDDRRRMLESGAGHLGWKVGFGAPSALEMMQIRAPLLGFLTDATVFEPGAEVRTAGWERGVVEFEVAVHMGTDLGEDATPDEARAAVAALSPSIELADISIDPLEAAEVENILASDIFHRGVILGEPDETRSGLDLTGLTARILVDGKEHAVTTDLEQLTGAYDGVVATVANTLAAMGESLRAGDVIITGSVIPPVPVSAGSEFVFELGDFPAISVRLG
jgi:2-keto-4-pentenoate hydratase